MTYKCEWCGRTEKNPCEYEERETGYRGLTCSRCGSDVHEAEMCIECDEYFSKECGDDFFRTAQGEGYCSTCLKALCNTKTGLEYLRHFNLTDEFVNYLVDFNEFPFVKRVLLNYINSIEDEHEAVKEKLWEYICDDLEHFANYIYNKQKGGEEK